MSKNLIIVESPAKCKTIEKYLGKDFTVLASYGHVRELPRKNGSVDVDNNFEIQFQVAKDSEKNLKAIAKAAEKADTIYLATDPDREGEAISWHVLEEIKKRLKTKFNTKEVKRMTFTQITKSAVQHAVDNPKALNTNLIDAQKTRQALDYLVGFNLSPVLWRKVRTGLSAGRVQSVALRLVCEREAEIEAFDPKEYWSMEGHFDGGADSFFKAKLATLNGGKVEQFTITNEADAKAAKKALEAETYSISSIETKRTQRRPSPPFITSTLQQAASNQLRFVARQTMRTAQKLYEAGRITYMRTDSTHLAGEAVAMIRSQITQAYGSEYVPEKPIFYKSKNSNAQEAHEAVRPTDMSKRAADMGLSGDEAKLYDLIWRRTMACQMANAQFDATTVHLPSSNQQHAFRASGRVMIFPGFMAVLGTQSEDDLLPALQEGAQVPLKEVTPEQHFTEPPPRFNEASLVKTLEEYGIGRPSTYASIISVIQDRGYVRLEQRRFYPEDVGRIVNNFLTEHFGQYVDYDFTANLEGELDKVAEGDAEMVPTLTNFWQPFKQQVEHKLETVKKSDITTEATGESCPTCQEGELVIRLGRYGRFKACNRYPECKHAEPLDGDKDKGEKEAPKDTGVQCPECKKDNIGQKKSRRGKIFYSCNSYPACKYAIWDAPKVQACPQCAWPIVTVKETKRFGTVHKCPQKECGWQDKETVARKKKVE